MFPYRLRENQERLRKGKKVEGATDLRVLELKIAEMHGSFNAACESIEAAVEQFSQQHIPEHSSKESIQRQLNEKNKEIERLKKKELEKEELIEEAAKEMREKFESALAKLNKMAKDS
eukprot:TRINITY_DN12193_c0_g1_i2.p3 TRINITY_DN12193_c0_g1~~TRINITY_DN12193_c0_g1_i2.p3  ORF type:complete len:118 (+),score=40.98 TRINITY_DN12193_c0_g1_i2:251-604(+)